MDKSIAFYVGTFFTAPMDGQRIGGSEIATFNVATALIKAGYRVVIYGALDAPTAIVRGVECRNWEHMRVDSDKFDLLIVSRFVYAFDFYRDNLVRFDRIFLWMHDAHFHNSAVKVNPHTGQLEQTTLPNFGIDDLMKHANLVEKIICVSNWQRELQRIHFKVPETLMEKMHVIHNGVADSLFDMDISQKRPHSFIYTTDPTRAMEPILAIWPKIRMMWPDATMDVFFYGHVEDSLVAQMRAAPGFTWHGKVDNEEIYRHLTTSSIYFYPSLSHETFGLSTVQASALGCKVISRAYSGLAETGSLIGSILLSDEKLQHGHHIITALQKPGPSPLERVKTHEHFAMKNIAKDWLDLITSR